MGRLNVYRLTFTKPPSDALVRAKVLPSEARRVLVSSVRWQSWVFTSLSRRLPPGTRRSFYFRERHEERRIELDWRPSGRFAQVVRGTDDEGNMVTEDVELDEGDTIATGTIEAAGYGTTLVQRGQFIVDTIRAHLARKSCALHSAEKVRLPEDRLIPTHS